RGARNLDVDAVAAVGDGGGARWIGPDQVPLDQAGGPDVDAVVAVARDRVARAGRRPADRRGRRPGGDADEGIGDGGVARRIRADQVPLHQAGRIELDAEP